MISRITRISFPGLGIKPFEVESEAFSLFGRPIAWYALIITAGIILAFAYVMYRKEACGLTTDDVIDYALFTVPAGIIGGRTYYVLTSLDNYHSFADAIAIWEGGMAIYGAIIGGALAVILVSRFKHKSFLACADCISPAVMIGQILGRWGNFVNGEAYGYETELPWRMGIERHGITTYVHPTFIYESLWNLVGLLLINAFFKQKKYNGQIFYMCFAWYGFGRMFIEGLRSDSLYIFGNIRISQAVGAGCFIVFGGLLLYNLIKEIRMKKVGNSNGNDT